jgi:hypothetical protein
MKTKTYLTKGNVIVFLSLLGMILFSVCVSAQDSEKKAESKKQIKVIIKKDKGGTSSVLDTTITINREKDAANLKKIMKEYQIDMKGLSDDMEEMIVNINDMDLPDSGKIDSLSKVVKRIRIIGKDGMKGKCCEHSMMYGFDDSDWNGLPCPPPPPPPDGMEEFGDFQGVPNYPGFGERRGGTISDVIGDIPMDMVRSYSVKETKHGKRIVIELNNPPLMRTMDKVVIIRQPGHREHSDHYRMPKVEKKVIIIPDGSEEKEKSPKM